MKYFAELSHRLSGDIWPERRKLRVFHLLLAGVCLALCLPIWAVDYAPLLDWPNHFARAYILANYHRVPEFREAFVINSYWRPNVGLDWLGAWLLKVVPPVIASKILLSVLVVLFVIGTYMLTRSLWGTPTVGVILATYFVYNTMFLYGFSNYFLGVGLFFVALAVWLDERIHMTLRLFLSALLGFMCWFAHLTAYGFLCAGVILSTITQYSGQQCYKRTLLGLLPLAGGFIATVVYVTELDKVGRVGNLRWEGIVSKALGASYLFASYNFVVDALFAAGFASMGLLAYLLSSRQKSVLLMSLFTVFVVAFLFMPTAGFAGTWAIDRRLVLPAAVCVLLPIGTLRSQRWVIPATFSFVLVLARCLWVTSIWYPLGQEITQQVRLLSGSLEPAGRVYPVTLLETNDKAAWMRQMAFRHSICYAILSTHLIPANLHADPAQHSLFWRHAEARVGYKDITPPFPVPGDVLNPQFIGRHWDYVVGYRLTPSYEQFLCNHFRLIARYERTWIFATKR